MALPCRKPTIHLATCPSGGGGATAVLPMRPQTGCRRAGDRLEGGREGGGESGASPASRQRRRSNPPPPPLLRPPRDCLLNTAEAESVDTTAEDEGRKGEPDRLLRLLHKYLIRFTQIFDCRRPPPPPMPLPRSGIRREQAAAAAAAALVFVQVGETV